MKLILIIIAINVAVIFAAHGESPIPISPCELMKDPSSYDRKLVTVRSGVQIGFEDSSFDVDCSESVQEPIWVTFAGDVEMPVVFCCGDHSREKGATLEIDGITLKLEKDAEFKSFYELLTATRKLAPTGVSCFYDCFQYKVKANLTGHFFAKHEERNSENKLVSIAGYGHFGFESLFVIEKVSDIESQHSDVPFGNDFHCERMSKDFPIEKSEIIAKQNAVSVAALSEPSISEDGKDLVQKLMKENGDSFDQGDYDYDENPFENQQNVSYVWLSKDKLKSYEVNFERFSWLAPYAKKFNDRIWTATSIERVACMPTN